MSAKRYHHRRRVEEANERWLRNWAFSQPDQPEPPSPLPGPRCEQGFQLDPYDPADALSQALSSPTRQDEDPLEERLERYRTGVPD